MITSIINSNNYENPLLNIHKDVVPLTVPENDEKKTLKTDNCTITNILPSTYSKILQLPSLSFHCFIPNDFFLTCI